MAIYRALSLPAFSPRLYDFLCSMGRIGPLSDSITSYLCGGTGLIVPECCNVVILMEPAPNFNLEMQAIGRAHRLGQMKPQQVYRLFQEHTINRCTFGISRTCFYGDRAALPILHESLGPNPPWGRVGWAGPSL